MSGKLERSPRPAILGVQMNSLSVFQFDETEVRVVLDETNSPWFHASDCAKALGYLNPPEAIRDHVSAKYSKTLSLGLPGKKPLFVSEPGLYQLVMRSNLSSAERFQDWVFEEVLPTIRKTGKYEIPQAPQQSPDELEILLRTTEALSQVTQQIAKQRAMIFEQQQQIDVLIGRSNRLLENQAQAEAELKALPTAPFKAVPKSSRAKLNEIVRNYVARTNGDYREVWNKLYRELRYRVGYDVKRRAEIRQEKPLDILEQNGLLDHLLAIACEILIPGGSKRD
ncbi:MAG: BRO family protein [Crinalium sp.]